MKIIITEQQYQSIKLRRNLVNLPKFIRSTYKWYNPRAFDSLEEFLDRLVFSVTRDFVAEYINPNDDFDALRAKFEPIVKDAVMSKFYDEIHDYFEEEN